MNISKLGHIALIAFVFVATTQSARAASVCVAKPYSGSDGQLVHASTVRTPTVII